MGDALDQAAVQCAARGCEQASLRGRTGHTAGMVRTPREPLALPYSPPFGASLLGRHKLPKRSFHAFRHNFLTTLVRGGADPEAVRELAGH